MCQVEALQREVCARVNHWQQQRQREADLLSDLDAALGQCVTGANSSQVRGDGILPGVRTQDTRWEQHRAEAENKQLVLSSSCTVCDGRRPGTAASAGSHVLCEDSAVSLHPSCICTMYQKVTSHSCSALLGVLHKSNAVTSLTTLFDK